LAPLDFENFSKKGCFRGFEWEKANVITLGRPLKKFWKNPFVASLEKNPPDAQESS